VNLKVPGRLEIFVRTPCRHRKRRKQPALHPRCHFPGGSVPYPPQPRHLRQAALLRLQHPASQSDFNLESGPLRRRSRRRQRTPQVELCCERCSPGPVASAAFWSGSRYTARSATAGSAAAVEPNHEATNLQLNRRHHDALHRLYFVPIPAKIRHSLAYF